MKSIRSKAMLFSLTIIMLTISALGMISYHFYKEIMIDEINMAVVRVAEETADHLGYLASHYISPLKKLAENEKVQTMDWSVQKNIIVNQINPNYESVAVVSMKGVANYIDGTVLELSDRNYIQQVLSGRTTFSEVITSRKTGAKVIMAAVPIIKKKNVVGALIARLDVNFLMNFSSLRGYGKNGRAYVISNQGSFISRSPSEQAGEIYNLFEQAKKDKEYIEFSKFVRENSSNVSGHGQFQFNHETILIGFAAIENSNWNIYIGTSKEDALTSLKQLKLILYMGMIIALLLSFIVAWYFAGVLTKPILELDSLLSQGSQGDLKIRYTRKSKDEIGRAGQSFNNMMDKIKTLTQYDPLTSLLNQFVLERKVELLSNNKDLDEFSLIMVSIDRFAYINETYGYALGDRLLCEIATRITRLADETCSVYRYKGDEFVILCLASNDDDNALRLSKTIFNSLTECYETKGKTIELSISMGVFVWCKELNYEDPLKAVTQANNYAKHLGGNQIQRFSKEIHTVMKDRFELQADIMKGLRENEFLLVYQPLFYLSNEKISKLEALIRWDHPTRGLVYPDKFIELAEQSELIIELDMWVVETVCKQLNEWKKRDKELFIISVNVTSKTFETESFVPRLTELLQRYDIEPKLLQLEITERMVIKNVEESIIKLNELKTMGISVSIDDFGIGYSSLSYIVRLPIDSIKIDQSFVQNLSFSEEAKVIITAIIALCKSLKLTVIAEGIESCAELEYLKTNNCDIGQGYYFSKPVQVEIIEKYRS